MMVMVVNVEIFLCVNVIVFFFVMIIVGGC